MALSPQPVRNEKPCKNPLKAADSGAARALPTLRMRYYGGPLQIKRDYGALEPLGVSSSWVRSGFHGRAAAAAVVVRYQWLFRPQCVSRVMLRWSKLKIWSIR